MSYFLFFYAECHCAECSYAECYMLNVVMLNVVMLNVIMLNVVMLNFVMLSVAAPSMRPNFKPKKFPKIFPGKCSNFPELFLTSASFRRTTFRRQAFDRHIAAADAMFGRQSGDSNLWL
jgi:hypothetical protein